MLLKNNFYLKISILLALISLILPLFDPYYNLKLKNHIFISLKIWIAFTIKFFIIIYLIKKIKSK